MHDFVYGGVGRDHGRLACKYTREKKCFLGVTTISNCYKVSNCLLLTSNLTLAWTYDKQLKTEKMDDSM